jgi:hypothetical protein
VHLETCRRRTFVLPPSNALRDFRRRKQEFRLHPTYGSTVENDKLVRRVMAMSITDIPIIAALTIVMTRTLLGYTLGQLPKHRRVSPVANWDGLARRESLHTFEAPLLTSFSVPSVSPLVSCSETQRESLPTLKDPFIMVRLPLHQESQGSQWREDIQKATISNETVFWFHAALLLRSLNTVRCELRS